LPGNGNVRELDVGRQVAPSTIDGGSHAYGGAHMGQPMNTLVA
jgi:hypothetical protein